MREPARPSRPDHLLDHGGDGHPHRARRPLRGSSSWESLGDSYLLLGEHGAAASCLERAMVLFRHLGSRADEAGILAALGDIQLSAGEPDAAQVSFQQALAIFGELRLPQAEQVRGRLADVTRPGRSLPA